jgi:hypothetical protein
MFLLLKDMSKVRIGHEDAFIGQTYHRYGDTFVQDTIPEKYHFYYNPNWVAIRKIKAFPMTFVFEALIGYLTDIHDHQSTITHVIKIAFTENQDILDMLESFCKRINELVANDLPNTDYAIKYQYNKGNVILSSNFSTMLLFQFVFSGNTTKIFNVNEDPNNAGNSIVSQLIEQDNADPEIT